MPLVYTFKGPDIQYSCTVACQQCSATAAGGQRCRNRACIGGPQCWLHLLRDSKLRMLKSTVAGAGTGLFAMDRKARPGQPAVVVFKKGDVVTPYGGEIVSRAVLNSRYGQYTAPYGIQLRGADRFENGACVRGPGSMANHVPRSRANAEFRLSRANLARIVATKRIYSGQEVLVSYGSEYRMNEPTTSTTTRVRARARAGARVRASGT